MEEYLTLDELMLLCEHVANKEYEDKKFHAQLAGADVKGGKQQQPENHEDPVAKRIRERKQNQQQQEAREKGQSSFSQGVGYQVIGG